MSPTVPPYQCQTAGEDHDDDDSLEVLVLDHLERVAPAQPPELPHHRAIDHPTARALLRAADGAAVVGIFEEYDVYLVDLRPFQRFFPLQAGGLFLRDREVTLGIDPDVAAETAAAVACPRCR